MYEFRCSQCFIVETMHKYYPIGTIIDFPCPQCGGRMKRIASNIGFQRSMPAHYNPSVGTYVQNEREFRDELKRASDEASARTGMPHNFVPVDLNDRQSLGVTDDGMEQIERNNALSERGSAPVHVGEAPGHSGSLGSWGTFDERTAQDAREGQEP